MTNVEKISNALRETNEQIYGVLTGKLAALFVLILLFFLGHIIRIRGLGIFIWSVFELIAVAIVWFCVGRWAVPRVYPWVYEKLWRKPYDGKTINDVEHIQ